MSSVVNKELVITIKCIDPEDLRINLIDGICNNIQQQSCLQGDLTPITETNYWLITILKALNEK